MTRGDYLMYTTVAILIACFELILNPTLRINPGVAGAIGFIAFYGVAGLIGGRATSRWTGVLGVLLLIVLQICGFLYAAPMMLTIVAMIIGCATGVGFELLAQNMATPAQRPAR